MFSSLSQQHSTTTTSTRHSHPFSLELTYLAHSDTAFARSLRSFLHRDPGRALRHLWFRVRTVLENLGGVAAAADDAEHVPLAVVVAPSSRAFLSTERRAGQMHVAFLGLEFFTPEPSDPDLTCRFVGASSFVVLLGNISNLLLSLGDHSCCSVRLC